jgi:hypothetical protein
MVRSFGGTVLGNACRDRASVLVNVTLISKQAPGNLVSRMTLNESWRRAHHAASIKSARRNHRYGV